MMFWLEILLSVAQTRLEMLPCQKYPVVSHLKMLNALMSANKHQKLGQTFLGYNTCLSKSHQGASLCMSCMPYQIQNIRQH